MRKSILGVVALAVVLVATGALFFVAKTDVADPKLASESPEEKLQPDTVFIDKIAVSLTKSIPIQARAAVMGNAPDSCTEIRGTSVRFDGAVFEITLDTERPPETLCAQVLTPFEEEISLNLLGLKAGKYAVTANGARAEFTLDKDNVPPSSGASSGKENNEDGGKRELIPIPSGEVPVPFL